jgi:hypothetical protein
MMMVVVVWDILVERINVRFLLLFFLQVLVVMFVAVVPFQYLFLSGMLMNALIYDFLRIHYLIH